jgi:hypothetical protein
MKGKIQMRNKTHFKSTAHQLLVVLLSGVLLSSCAGQATSEPTVDPNAIQTSAVQTFMAALTQTQAAQPTVTETASPTITNTPLSLPTLAPPPTSTPVLFPVVPTIIVPIATGTQYTPTVNPALAGVGCNNLRLVAEVTIPSGTVFQPGDHFTKTWKVENNGTCDWVYQYSLAFVSGDRMGGDPGYLGKTIVPGKWTELSVTMRAPKDPGTYTGNWRMTTQAGSPFGATLTVSIKVATPTNTPKPTTYP